MTDVKKVVFAVIKFLNGQLLDGGLSEESKESLEVAVQCLETSFDVSSSDSHLGIDKSLLQLVGQQSPAERSFKRAPEATAEQKEQAEKLKNDGNCAVRDERIQDAVQKYSQAIEFDGNNAAYYSNRAVAHTKLGNFETAVNDAETALSIDPTYTKAHSRKALAYAGLNRLPEAHEAIKRALELDPGNESYANNMRAIEARIAEAGAAQSQGPGGMFGNLLGAGGGGGFGPGGLNLDAMMSNPALMNMASQMMQDPSMQQMMSSFMSGMPGGLGVPGAPGASAASGTAPETAPGTAPAATETENAATNGAPPAGFEALLHAGQRLAEQVRTTNPELIEQIRQQMGGPPDQQPPPGTG